MQTDEVQQQMKSFDDTLRSHLQDESYFLDNPIQGNVMDLDITDQDYIDEFHTVVGSNDIQHADDLYNDHTYDETQDDGGLKRKQPEPTPDTYDTYIDAEVALPLGTEAHPQLARVAKRVRDSDGNPVGTKHSNPLLDTRSYIVQFHTGEEKEITANLIAEHILSQVNGEGHRELLLDEIIDYRRDDNIALKQSEAFTYTRNNTTRRKPTTIGWDLLVQWKDGSTNWIELKDMKHSYPVQVAEYAIANKIDKEPAFAWWVDFVIRKRRQISKVKSKYWQTTHKYGIRVPKSAEEAKRIDAENGDTKWWDAIELEMKNVRVAFNAFGGTSDEARKQGYKFIKCHMIFDIKLSENFRRKA